MLKSTARPTLRFFISLYSSKLLGNALAVRFIILAKYEYVNSLIKKTYFAEFF